MPVENAAPEAADAFARGLAAERLQNGRRLSWLRFVGVSGFFALTAVLGVVANPLWHANLGLFAA